MVTQSGRRISNPNPNKNMKTFFNCSVTKRTIEGTLVFFKLKKKKIIERSIHNLHIYLPHHDSSWARFKSSWEAKQGNLRFSGKMMLQTS